MIYTFRLFLIFWITLIPSYLEAKSHLIDELVTIIPGKVDTYPQKNIIGDVGGKLSLRYAVYANPSNAIDVSAYVKNPTTDAVSFEFTVVLLNEENSELASGLVSMAIDPGEELTLKPMLFKNNKSITLFKKDIEGSLLVNVIYDERQ